MKKSYGSNVQWWESEEICSTTHNHNICEPQWKNYRFCRTCSAGGMDPGAQVSCLKIIFIEKQWHVFELLILSTFGENSTVPLDPLHIWHSSAVDLASGWDPMATTVFCSGEFEVVQQLVSYETETNAASSELNCVQSWMETLHFLMYVEHQQYFIQLWTCSWRSRSILWNILVVRCVSVV